jgi:hypothetical protein
LDLGHLIFCRHTPIFLFMGMRKKPVAVRQPDDNVLDLGDTNRCNTTALRKATCRVSQLYDSGLAPSGLRSTERSILLNIARFGSPTLGQLADFLPDRASAAGGSLLPFLLADRSANTTNRLKAFAPELRLQAVHRLEISKRKNERETCACLASSRRQSA